MRRLLITVLLFLFVYPTFAVDKSNRTYTSEDGAVQFTYSGEWTVEDQIQTFNQRYLYQLWTNSSVLTAYLGNSDHSRILIELINPATSAYPRNLTTPQEYATYILSKPVNYDSFNHKMFGVYGNTLKDTVNNDDNNSKFNTIYVYPTWFAAEPAASRAVTISDDPGVRTALKFPAEANRRAILEVVVRKDGWVMVASVNAPPEELASGERALLEIAKSLVFDAKKAATPFERDLKTYDFSKISLKETYNTTDGNFEVNYPAGWHVTDLSYGEPAMGVIFAQFEPPDKAVELDVFVLDTTSETMGLSPTQNSAEEFMQEQRRLAAVNGSQFRIGTYDAVKLLTYKKGESRREIYFALNDSWIAGASISGKDATSVTEYEASAVAVLASLKFTLGESLIDFEVLQAELPDSWIHVANAHDDNDYYRFALKPANRADFSNLYIVIELVNLKTRGYSNVTFDDLKNILPQVVTRVDYSNMIRVKGHKALCAETYTESDASFGEYVLYMVNDQWLVVVSGRSTFQDAAYGTLQDMMTIINKMDISLPDASSK